MSDIVQVQFTIDSTEAADDIINSLLGKRLVAGAQRSSPVLSRYWWHDNIEEVTEWLVTMKTRADLAGAVVDHLMALHSYAVPEVLVLPIYGGNQDYLDWVAETTRSHPAV
jgi:periplasmic divalent cation tolerance protein